MSNRAAGTKAADCNWYAGLPEWTAWSSARGNRLDLNAHQGDLCPYSSSPGDSTEFQHLQMFALILIWLRSPVLARRPRFNPIEPRPVV